MSSTHGTLSPGEPLLRPAVMHRCPPDRPAAARVVSTGLCTAGRRAASVVRHVVLDVGGTPLEGSFLPGQSLGVLAPGVDEKGKPHKPRLYSIASPARGEDGHGKHVAFTVKRLVAEHEDRPGLFLGVTSNYLCDVREGDEVRLTGPSGKRFVLPQDVDAHDYLFLATGTGIAPFRGMLMEMFGGASPTRSRVVLVMGSPYATDLLYDDQLRELAKRHPNFTYAPALSRQGQEDGGGAMYAHDRMLAMGEPLASVLRGPRALVYVCGVAGMELGVLGAMRTLLGKGPELAQYLALETDAPADVKMWTRAMLHRQVRPTRRVIMEVYE